MSTADLTALLRESRPVAPETLRDRVRAIAASADASHASRFRLPALPRLRVAVPVVAATAVAAAALIAVVRPGHQAARREAATGAAGSTLSTVDGANHTYSAQAAPAKTTPRRTLAPDRPASTGAAPTPTAGRAQDYEAQIGLEVNDDAELSSATKRAMAIARALGGFVLSAQYASSETGTAALTLRVPVERVQDAIAQLTALGRITSQQVQIQDLQGQLDQLERQIDTLRGRIAHITALLANPDLTATRRVELEAQRAALQAVLRRERQQRGSTARQAALATIQLTLATKQQSATPLPSSRFRRSLHQLGRVLAWEGIGAVYAVAVTLPFALVGLLVWVGARTRRRGEERRLLARS